MAGSEMDLKLKLLGDSSDLERATADAERGIGKLGKVVAGLGLTGAAGGAALSAAFAEAASLEEGQAKLTAQLGLAANEAGEYGALAGSIYADNFGADMGSVNAALKSVSDNFGTLGDVGEAEMTRSTEAALTLASTFDVEVGQTAEVASKLIKNGLAKNSSEAFDIITAGMQNGANRSGDFLDTLSEYSPQFAKLGIDGEQALGILQAGLKAGARDTDTIADAFKEFSLRSIDGSKLTASGFKAAGLDAKKMAAEIAKGGPSAEAATAATLKGLQSIKDPQAQNTAGVALFGTQWEDTLRQILPAIAGAGAGAESVKGSTDRMTEAMGGTGKAKVETLRREFDTWVQSQVNSSGASSTAVAAIGSFGPAALSMAGSLGMAASGLAALNLGTGVAKVAQLASAAATGIWTGAQWLLNAALTANPIGIVIVGIAALIAIIVTAWKRSNTFRMVIAALWSAIKTGAAATWGALRAFGVRFAGWVTSLTQRGAKVIGWFKGLPGKIRGAFGDLGGVLTRAGRQIIDGLLRGITDRFDTVRRKLNELTGMLPDWKGPASVDAKILYGSGALVAGGFEAGFLDRFNEVKGAMGAQTLSLSGAVSTSQRAAVGGASAIHIHTPAVITSDRDLIRLIDGARARTSRSRTVASASAGAR